MDISMFPPPLLLLTLLTLSSFPSSTTSADLYTLVYKGCANQTSSSSSSSSAQQTLFALSAALTVQSTTAKFFKTTISGDPPIFGLFQCRGDLSPSDCAACVRTLPAMWATICGPTASAARIQLAGCYALYQVSGFPQVSGTQLLYKTCGGSTIGRGFEEQRGTVFGNLVSGVAAAGGGGFYATSYGAVYAMVQCEGDLSTADCGKCVTEAVQKAAVECGSASSGQVYLEMCYTAYSYHPNGVSHGGQQTGRTVAIVMGGAAALGFLVIFLLFVRSILKKRDDY